MTDVSQTIAPKSDQLNADDLIAGPRTITVTKVVGNESAEQPISIFYEGDNGKPFKPSLSMRRVLVKVWGGDGDTYVGRRMTLYLDPEVKFGGIKVGGIRISHMSHIDRPMALMLTQTRGKKAEFKVLPLAETDEQGALMRAKEAARNGRAAFEAYWKSEDRVKHNAIIVAATSDLQALVQAAEEASKPLSQRLQADTPPETEAPPAPAESVVEDAKPSQPFMEGIEAHAKGKQDTDCPYDSDPDKAAWLDGWFKAEEGK